MTFGSNLRAFLQEHEIKPVTLAREMKKHPERINRILQEDYNNPRLQTIKEVKKALLGILETVIEFDVDRDEFYVV